MRDVVVVERYAPTTTITENVQGPPGPPGPVGPQGPEGPPGPPGEGAGYTTYMHTQTVASATWDVTHDLGRYPGVVVMDTAGNEVVGDVQYVNGLRVIITFSAPFSGTAQFV